MTIQSIARAIGAIIVTVSVVGMPHLLLAAQPTATPTPPTRAAPSNIDPHWQTLIKQVDLRAARQPAQAQAFAPTLHINLSNSTIVGRVSLPDAVTLRFIRSGYTLVSYSLSPTFDGNEYLFIDSSLGGIYLAPNDELEVSQTNQRVTVAIPSFSAAADSSINLVSGYVTSHTLAHVQATSFTTPTLSVTQNITVAADNIITANLSGLMDLRPHDYGFVWVDVSSDIHIYRAFSAPQLLVESGGPMIASPNGFPGPVRIDITDSANQPRTHIDLPGQNGRFVEPLTLIEPLTLTLNAGDHVIANTGGSFGSFSVTVPRLTVRADASGTHLYGDAPANAPVDVRWFSGFITQETESLLGYLEPLTHVQTTANALGAYIVPLSVTEVGYALVSYTTTEGHEVFARYLKPYVRARLGPLLIDRLNVTTGYNVAGQFGQFRQPLTITVQGPSGYQKIERHLINRASGYFEDAANIYGLPFNFITLDTGDVITVSTDAGEQHILQVPEFTAVADGIEQAVFGKAPPNAKIKITISRYQIPSPIPPPSPNATPTAVPIPTQASSSDVVVPSISGPYLWTTEVTANASGVYSITLPQFASNYEALTGEAELSLGEGNAVVRVFSESIGCRPYVSQINLNASILFLTSGTCDIDSYQAQVWSRDGQLKWGATNLTQNVIYLTEGTPSNDRRIPLEGGDQIRLTQGDYSYISTVPTLTVMADQATNRISGLSIPNLTVTLMLLPAQEIPYRADLYLNWYLTTTVADNTGHYQLALANEFTLTAGTYVIATVDDNHVSTIAANVVPLLNIFPSTPEINGKLEPFAPFTASLIPSGLPVSEAIQMPIAYADNAGNFQTGFSQSLRPNDQVRLESPGLSLSATVPLITGAIDLQQGVLQGSGPSNRQLKVWQWDSTALFYNVIVTPVGTTNISAAGQYSLALPSSALAARGNLELATRYDIDDNATIRAWQPINGNPIRWHVTLDSSYIDGSYPLDSQVITLTLRKASNPNNEITPVEFTVGPISFYAHFNVNLDPNDVATLQTTKGVFTFTIPLLTATYHNAADNQAAIISGNSAPNAHIQIFINDIKSWPYSQGIYRNASTTVNGTFGIDVSDVRPRLYTFVNVAYIDDFNNRVDRIFYAVLTTLSMPVILRN